MPINCAVPTCTGQGGFSFPKDKAMNLKWRVAIKREGQHKSLWKPTKHSRVCERHFKEDDYILPQYAAFAKNFLQHRRKLKTDAVPSIFSFTRPASGENSERHKRNQKRTQLQQQLQQTTSTLEEPVLEDFAVREEVIEESNDIPANDFLTVDMESQTDYRETKNQSVQVSVTEEDSMILTSAPVLSVQRFKGDPDGINF
jgi:hypothetical protein